MATIIEWLIVGAEGQAIIGNAHLPAGNPVGVVLIAHGFKGYKDYGMFPRIAEAAAAAGFIAHRFNFSHSGMTNVIETFERPELFERDTYNKQIHDLRAIVAAVNDGRLDGQGFAYVMFGHSRGGVTVLLTAGRYADDAGLPQPAGIITASAPSSCRAMAPQQAEALLAEGFLESPSARTGQTLRIGKGFLTEQLEEPDAHDLPALIASITCPVLIIHGEADPTVPAECAQQLAQASGETAEVIRIAGGNHVFNTPNPMPPDAESSPQLDELLAAVTEFVHRACIDMRLG